MSNKELILIVGLFDRHYIAIKSQLNTTLTKYEIQLWDCDKNKSPNAKQLRSLARRSHTIFGMVGKMGHNIEEIIKNTNKSHYQPVNGGVSQLVRTLNARF